MAAPFTIPDQVEHVQRCLVCLNESPIPDDKFAAQLGLIKPYGCLRCPECGLRWLSPRPTSHAYECLYTTENYFSGECAVENYEQLLKRRKIKFRKRIRSIGSYFAAGKTIKLLDVGAATGDFVQIALEEGFDAGGLELSDDARRKALERYSISLSSASLRDIAGQGSRYHVIHMNHVFEHFLNPRSILEDCFRILPNDGLLVLEVPQQYFNDLDRLRKILRLNRKPGFTPYSLHHTFFFNPANLSHLLEDSGFEVIRLTTANSNNTPFWMTDLKDFVLLVFLFLSDRIHMGGNMIEVVARKKWLSTEGDVSK